MARRRWVMVIAVLALMTTALFSSLPASASRPRDVSPSQIDPTRLALPPSTLPPVLQICLSGQVDASGNLTGGMLSSDLSTKGALACGIASKFIPATSTTAGTISVGAEFDSAGTLGGGKTFGIKPGVLLDGTAQVDSLDHSAVSNNDDANGTTTPPDGYKAQLRIIHQTGYDALGRITGYRMDFHYFLQTNLVGTEFLASIFPDSAHAQAAMDHATKSPALITIIGQPLTNQCTVGDACSAYSGPNPGTTNRAVLAVFRRGPILIETATQVPAATFAALEPTLETTLYGLLAAADARIKLALNPPPPGQPTDTPTPTSTPTATSTNTPVPTATDTPVPPTKKSCPKNASKKHGKCTCKKGYTMKKGKCVKKKK